MKRTGSEVPPRSQTHLTALTENELVEQCQSGDSDAWSVLMRRYSRIAYRAAYNLCHNREEANDIVGQVFLLLYQNIHQYRKQGNFRSWLLSIVRNTFVDQCVRPARTRDVSLDAGVNGQDDTFEGIFLTDPAPSPYVLCIRQEARDLVAGAVAGLPPRQRQVITMFYNEGKSYQAIAEEMRVPLGTVKARMHRGRHQLRERLLPQKEILLVV